MRKSMLVTMLGLAALLLPGSAQANHEAIHGPKYDGAASAIGPVVNCVTNQIPLALKGASETFIPPAVTSVTLTGGAESDCNASLPSLSEIALSFTIYRETPKFSGVLTQIASYSTPPCTNCFMKLALIPDTTITVTPDSRYILMTVHDWTLHSGSWSAFGLPCWGASAGHAVCRSFSDLIVS
jgi:hypothetical protein